jgi:hypothetical protein
MRIDRSGLAARGVHFPSQSSPRHPAHLGAPRSGQGEPARTAPLFSLSSQLCNKHTAGHSSSACESQSDPTTASAAYSAQKGKSGDLLFMEMRCMWPCCRFKNEFASGMWFHGDLAGISRSVRHGTFYLTKIHLTGGGGGRLAQNNITAETKHSALNLDMS